MENGNLTTSMTNQRPVQLIMRNSMSEITLNLNITLLNYQYNVEMLVAPNPFSGHIICVTIISETHFLDMQQHLTVSTLTYDHWKHIKMTFICHCSWPFVTTKTAICGWRTYKAVGCVASVSASVGKGHLLELTKLCIEF